MSKLDKMQRFLPAFYKPTTNTIVRGLLFGWSGEDDFVVQAIQDAKEQLFVQSAQLQFLDALGSNVGVFRPAAVNLADAQFRQLIPALSFLPKQVKPTIRKILDIFFGVGNPRVQINEINPNEIVIQIPSSVPSLRRSLKGALHIHDYSGTITAIDNIGKTLTINLDDPGAKSLVVDELIHGVIGQNLVMVSILSNTSGNTGVVLQFAASTDLSVFTTSRFRMFLQNYPGSFVPDRNKSYSLTQQRGTIGQDISQGTIYPTIIMQDASGIPDAPGRVVFNFGRMNEEADVRYFGRPNNTTLLIDPAYSFTKNHSIGEVVNVIVKPNILPRINGQDYAVYVVGVEAARMLAQQIIESVVAAGIVIRWIINEPVC